MFSCPRPTRRSTPRPPTLSSCPLSKLIPLIAPLLSPGSRADEREAARRAAQQAIDVGASLGPAAGAGAGQPIPPGLLDVHDQAYWHAQVLAVYCGDQPALVAPSRVPKSWLSSRGLTPAPARTPSQSSTAWAAYSAPAPGSSPYAYPTPAAGTVHPLAITGQYWLSELAKRLDPKISVSSTGVRTFKSYPDTVVEEVLQKGLSGAAQMWPLAMQPPQPPFTLSQVDMVIAGMRTSTAAARDGAYRVMLQPMGLYPAASERFGEPTVARSESGDAAYVKRLAMAAASTAGALFPALATVSPKFLGALYGMAALILTGVELPTAREAALWEGQLRAHMSTLLSSHGSLSVRPVTVGVNACLLEHVAGYLRARSLSLQAYELFPERFTESLFATATDFFNFFQFGANLPYVEPPTGGLGIAGIGVIAAGPARPASTSPSARPARRS